MQKILYIISVAALLVGCNKKDDVTDSTWNGEIRLSSGITAQTRATQDYQSAQLNAGNLVGVFINEHGGNSTTYTQNVQYTANGSGSFADAPTVYFPASGNPVNIYAYAPRNEVWNDLEKGYTFTVNANQHSEADYIASDLLWGEPMSTGATPKPLNPVARTKEAINLHFRHLLSKVRVTIANGAGVTSEDVTKVELLDLLPSTEMKMADGTISVAKGDKTNVVLFDDDAEIVTSASAVVVPQTVATNTKFLRFGLKQGGELFYTLPKELTMESGKIYDFTITMNLTGMTVKSTVSDWETGEGLTGGAEMPGPIGSKTDPATAVIGDFYFSDGTLEASTATLTDDQKAACIGIVYSTDISRIGTAATNALSDKGVTPHGLVMALTNASEGSRWGESRKDENSGGNIGEPFRENTDQLKKQYANVDGYGETQWMVNKIATDVYYHADTYKAFDVASKYGTGTTAKYKAPANTTGWFIPSMGQWWDIISNLGDIDLSGYRNDPTNYIYITGGIAQTAVDNMNRWLNKIDGVPAFGLSTYYWSSSEYDGTYACYVNFRNDGSLGLIVNGKNYSNIRVRCSLAF